MTALLQHSALNSRALAASDKYSKSNRPVFALRLPDRPAARHRSTLTSLCHPKTLSNRHLRPPVYRCKSLENKSSREQIEVNEWYSGECNDGLIKGPGASACTYGGLHVRWRTDSRMVLLANTPSVFWKMCAFCESYPGLTQGLVSFISRGFFPRGRCVWALPCSLVPDC